MKIYFVVWIKNQALIISKTSVKHFGIKRCRAKLVPNLTFKFVAMFFIFIRRFTRVRRSIHTAMLTVMNCGSNKLDAFFINTKRLLTKNEQISIRPIRMVFKFYCRPNYSEHEPFITREKIDVYTSLLFIILVSYESL